MSFLSNISDFFSRLFGSAPTPPPATLMDLDTLNAFWTGQRGPASPVRLMGFRGGLEPAGSPNAFGFYDDLIVVLIDGAQPTFWKASVDPAPALVRNPVNSDGAAQLCLGVHFMGIHFLHDRQDRPCLGQAEAVHVNRLRADGSIAGVQFGDFGICIHSGGAPDDTQRFSAGCQIVHNPDGYFGQSTWGRFLNPITSAMRWHGLTRVPYMLTAAPNLSAPQHLENV